MKWFITLIAFAAYLLPCFAADNPAPIIKTVTVSNGVKTVTFTPAPAIDRYMVQSSTNVAAPFSNDTSGVLNDMTFRVTNSLPTRFYNVAATPMSSNALLAANILNRLAYGPTPDDLLTVSNAPQAYINQQLAPETITETIDNLPLTETTDGTNNWIYVTATGTGSSSALYLYLSDAGEAYIDDIKLVVGTQPGAGANLVANGDFEGATFPAPSWTIGTNGNLSNSVISTTIKHGGAQSLHLISTDNGSTRDSSIYQTITPSLSTTQTYTLSFWYLPLSVTNVGVGTVRLSGNGIVAMPDQSVGRNFQRLNNHVASINDLRAWFCAHAVGAKRQLIEVLTQFLENHFVTQYSKTQDYMGRYYPDGGSQQRAAVDMEFREIMRWRQALLDPNCTFSNLLRISAESPAMIVYLDTVTSRGDGTPAKIANENYARELLELFTMGVDNGYDQNDITVMSRAWTGWRIELVNVTNVNNPFAPKTTVTLPGAPNNAYTNLVGLWSCNYQSQYHYTISNKLIFGGKTVPPRFGPPWAGTSYQLNIPATSGTNGLSDGYRVIAHLSNLPFTEEFISVKLCRLFVHDQFEHGVYDYTLPNLSPEAKLVHDCMLAWENSAPKGNIRAVLSTIFNSDLFRSHGGSLQKVKTPLELCASTIRALRADLGGGTNFSASTDGYTFATPLSRMGTMLLFNRDAPDGYPEAGDPWISAGTVAERIRYVESSLIGLGQTGKGDAGANNITAPVALLQAKLPSNSWTSAAAVVDYFLAIIYPGEGKGNLDALRTAAISFLNTDNNRVASAFSSLAVSGAPLSPYDQRVRGMVAMLMSSPRFQEQ
jgi:uncharacterized protein (DUF1800 family)